MYITILDYALLPLYLALFYWHVRKKANGYEEAELKKFLMVAFGLRMFGSFAYSMVVQYYYGYGDSFTYYDGGNFFREQININIDAVSYLFSSFKETEAWYDATSLDTYFSGYFSEPANNMVMRISAIISYLSFNSFLIISLFFGFFSFWGQWKLFMVFDNINKQRNRKLLAYAILYSPSIWFWGSGLLKDSICLGAVGFIVHILYKFFIKRKTSLIDLLLLGFLIFITNLIKPYIITIITIGIVVMFFSVFLKSFKNILARALLILIGIVMFVFILFTGNFVSQINKIAEESVASIQLFQKNYQISREMDESSQAGFGLGEMELTLGSLVLKSPVVIFTCLFRPFVWESRKIFILFTSFESLLVFLATIYVMFKIGFISFFKTIFITPHLLFCFTISMLFALIIGFTTFNFGTMIRYKIIFLPFYYFLVVNLYSTYSETRKKLPV